MKRLKQLCFILFAFAGQAVAAPIVSGNSGDWNNPATWVGGVIPVAGDHVTIANGHLVSVTSNAACGSIVIGNGLLDQSTSLSLGAGVALAVSGNISITAALSGTTDNTLDINDGTASCTSFITNNSAGNSMRCIVSINNGTLTCSSNFLLANNTSRNKLVFSGAGLLQLAGAVNTIANAQFNAATGTIEYNRSSGQIILPLSYHTLKCSNNGNKTLSANTTLTGDLQIAGTAQLDVTAAYNYNINIAGSWTVTSTSTDPFIERKGTVTFNGSGALQSVSTTLTRETFYDLTINNTAGNIPADIQFNKNCYVTQAYNHISGTTDLNGNKLIVISSNNTGGFTTCALSGGSITSSFAGAQISFTDNYDSTLVNITGTSIGNAYFPVALTINTGRINIENLSLYGVGNFTKTLFYNDVSAKGGNKFYNNVSFTTGATSGNWYTGAGNGAIADSFFARADFTNFINTAGTKFIIGANSAGNYYADSVIINNKSAGSFYVGNSSGAANGTQSSHYFNKITDITLSGSGDVVFAEGQSLLPSAVVFNKMLRIGSSAASTGSIYIGKNVAGSSVTLTSTAQLITGYVYGATSLYLYNVTQNGSLAQSFTNNNTATSKIIAGNVNGPCVWNGPVTFYASILDLGYSSFNGNSNSFTLKYAAANLACTGGNSFATGTANYFNNLGAADWYLASTAADDYNGDVFYRVNSTGAIYPAYNSNCTYAANIVILPSSDSVVFAAGAAGRVTIDGNSNSLFNNNSTKGTSMKRITMNKTGGTFTLYKPIFVPAGGNVTLTAGKMITAASALLILTDETCTITNVNTTSTSYIDGPMRYDISTTAPQTLHFPIGEYNESRPVELSIKHTTATSYSYTAEMINTSANALGWSYPASVYTVSKFRWWDIKRTVTSSGIVSPATELDLAVLPQVTLYYSYNDQVTNTSRLTICKNTYSATTSWIDIGGTGATVSVGKVTSTSSPTQFNSFSRFTLGYYGIPPAPTANDSSRCGTGTVTISATPFNGEAIDWYAAASGGTALASGSNTFTTPSISSTATYYAEARNNKGFISATRTSVKAIVYNASTVASFSPASGENGTVVIISGNYFTNVTGVSFGGTPAASYTVNSATQITATISAGTSGSVSVTNNCGTGSKTGFVYLPLTVWTGAVNNSWTTAGNWDDGVPTNIHCAVIPNVATLPLISSNQSVRSITIQTGASVDVAVGNNLNVKDSITNNGTVNGGGHIILNGTTSQVVSGTGSYNNLSLSNASGAVIATGGGNKVTITGIYTPTTGTLTTNNNIILKSTGSTTGTIATGAAGGGYINGTILLERYVPAKRAWRLINFPITSSAAPSINTALQEGAGGNASSNPTPGYGTHITGGDVAGGFDQNTSNNASMKEWNGSAWQGISSTNQTISNQLPYFVFVRGSRANNLALGTAAATDNTTLRLTANVKQGNQTIAVAGSGWQLTGNPFPSVINLDAVATANSSIINRNFKFWDPKLGGSNNVGGFVTASYNGFDYDYTPAPVSQLSEFAQPFMGFYVDAVAAGSIAVAEANKCNCGNGNVFRPAPVQTSTSKLYVELHSYNSDGSVPVVDGVLTAFNDSYSNSLDKYDATKLFTNLTENLSISRSTKKVSVERRKAIAVSDTIYLDISNVKLKKYRFEFKAENFDATVTSAFIEDSYTATMTAISLSETSNYDFTISNNPAAYANNRFRIVLQKESIGEPVTRKITSLTAGSQTAGNIRLMQNPVVNNTLQLMMTAKEKGNYTVTVLNEDGKEVVRKQFTHDGIDGTKNIALKKYLPKGLLHAVVTNASGSNTTFKIIVQ